MMISSLITPRHLHYSEAPNTRVLYLRNFQDIGRKELETSWPHGLYLGKRRNLSGMPRPMVDIYILFSPCLSLFHPKPSEMAERGHGGRDKAQGQQDSICCLPGSPACICDAVSRRGTSLDLLPGAFKVGANHTTCLIDITCIQGKHFIKVKSYTVKCVQSRKWHISLQKNVFRNKFFRIIFNLCL